MTSIESILRTAVDVLLLGTHALLGNGAMYGRAGTAMLAMMCKNYGIPVICCCETYKFSDRVMLDSIVSNEMSKFLFLSVGASQFGAHALSSLRS